MLVATIGAAALVVGGAGAAFADDPGNGTGPGVAPAGDTGVETTIEVTDEATYRQALTDLSADAGGPHVINVLADIVLDDGTDPTYTNATESLEINGNGFGIDAQGSSRILDHDTDAPLTINDWSVTGGNTSGSGGAIVAGGNVTVNRSAFTANSSEFDGGAIDLDDDAFISQSTFAGNTASEGEGGAIDTSDAGNATVADSTFSGNTASGGGGGISTEGTMTITNSTFTDNTSESVDSGGALDAQTDGGADVVLTYVTISSNTAPVGANIEIGDEATTTLVAFGTVIANPLGGGESCSFLNDSTTTSTFSYEQGGASCGFTGSGDTSDGADPQLGALADNGGPTPTMLPAESSPLVDAIPTADCDPAITTDQRGVTRPQGPGCDIGAVELEVVVPAAPVVVTPTFTG